MTTTIDIEELRDRARSDRHATSYPLVAVGAIGFHYFSFGSFADFVPWLYVFPLSFVVVWLLQWRLERKYGIGSGDDDALIIGCVVFVGTSLVSSETWSSIVPSTTRQYPSVWVIPTVVGLGLIAWRQRSRTLTAWALILGVGLFLGALFQSSSFDQFDRSIGYQTLLPQLAFLAAVLAGLRQLWTEHAAS